MRLSVTQFDVGNNASFVIWHCSTTQSTSPCFPNRTYFMWIAPSTWASKLKLGPKVKRCMLFWPVIRIFNFTFLYYLQFLLFRNTLWNFQMNCHYVGSFIKKRLIGNRTPDCRLLWFHLMCFLECIRFLQSQLFLVLRKCVKYVKCM